VTQPTTTNLLGSRPEHTWWRKIRVAFVPGRSDGVLDQVVAGTLEQFSLHGDEVQAAPNPDTDVILTTALTDEPLGWREALLFTARRRFGLAHAPVVHTLAHMTSARFRALLEHLDTALRKPTPDPLDYAFPGLAAHACRTLDQQGRRGGPLMALERLVQAQVKALRVTLIVGDDRPVEAYHFDLAGAHPRTRADDREGFCRDIALRIVNAASTTEVTQHAVAAEPIPLSLWQQLDTPRLMCTAAQELGKRRFFTEAVRVADLADVPALDDAIASQYSEGCFATYDSTLGALISTVTGSARPVDKSQITEDDLAVIVGKRADGKGVVSRHVDGKRNLPPSSEAVELISVDDVLPMVRREQGRACAIQVPAARSKLHGHRGVAAYDPRFVEYVPMDSAYLYYPVSCATDAQGWGIVSAFGRSQALRTPDDPRQVVFSILPGHGVMIVERWVPNAAPFEVICEYMDAGYLQVESRVPQGPLEYVAGPDGKRVLRCDG
jgi:hypothetical protein